MSWNSRRLASGAVAALIMPLLLLCTPSGSAVAATAPTGATTQHTMTQDSTGIVPNVVFWDAGNAIAAVEAAGFVAQTGGGFVDCGPPYVQSQWPSGGTSATLGSTVHLAINLQPGPGGICP